MRTLAERVLKARFLETCLLQRGFRRRGSDRARFHPRVALKRLLCSSFRHTFRGDEIRRQFQAVVFGHSRSPPKAKLVYQHRDGEAENQSFPFRAKILPQLQSFKKRWQTSDLNFARDFHLHKGHDVVSCGRR